MNMMYATFDITADNYNEFQTLVTIHDAYEPVIVQKGDITLVDESLGGEWVRVDIPIDYFHDNSRNPCEYAGYVGTINY